MGQAYQGGTVARGLMARAGRQVVWQESPLVRAARHGRILLVDEVTTGAPRPADQQLLSEIYSPQAAGGLPQLLGAERLAIATNNLLRPPKAFLIKNLLLDQR